MNATIHEQLYVLALVYTNDIGRLTALNHSGILNLNFNFSYKIPIPNDCHNVMDVINDLLLINGFFTDLNDFMCNNRLFQILFTQNRIETLTLNPTIEVLFKENNDYDEVSSNKHHLDILPTNESNDTNFFEMTLLKVAVLMEYEEMVKYLIECNSSIASTSCIDPIHLAIYQDNFQILNVLLNELSPEYIENKRINDLIDHNGLNPLHLAIFNQCIDSIRLLHKYGADINHVTDEVKFPLIWAMEIYEISDEVIETLLELNADTNKTDSETTLSPLIVAIITDRYELVKLILKHKADVNQKFDDCYTNPLKVAIDYYRENENGELILRALLDAGACLNFDLPEIINYSIPQQLTSFSDDRIQLLNPINELTMNRNYRRYPLILAIYIGCPKLVKLLLEYGAYPHTTEFDYYSPLCSACYVGNIEIVDLLLEYGVDPTLNCFQSNTPLTISIARNDMTIATRLLNYYRLPKNLDIQDSNGDFALLYASHNRNAKLVRKLLEHGANADLVNKHSVSALWYSVYNNDKSTFFELIKYARDFETKSCGINYEHFETVPIVIYALRFSPMMVAEFNHFYDMVYYLYCLGTGVTLELRERIAHKQEGLSEGNKNFEKLKVLNGLLNEPISLGRSCRKSIRKFVGIVDWDLCGDLLLPDSLNKLLSFEII